MQIVIPFVFNLFLCLRLINILPKIHFSFYCIASFSILLQQAYKDIEIPDANKINLLR